MATIFSAAFADPIRLPTCPPVPAREADLDLGNSSDKSIVVLFAIWPT